VPFRWPGLAFEKGADGEEVVDPAPAPARYDDTGGPALAEDAKAELGVALVLSPGIAEDLDALRLVGVEEGGRVEAVEVADDEAGLEPPASEEGKARVGGADEAEGAEAAFKEPAGGSFSAYCEESVHIG
jgi:hypothetical protein